MRGSTLTILIALAFSGAAMATHSASPCSGQPITIGAGSAALYVVTGDEYPWYIVYAETNRHAGLQRGGVAWYGPYSQDLPDPCWDVETETGLKADPDTIVL